MSDEYLPICGYCGGFIESLGQECPALDEGACEENPHPSVEEELLRALVDVRDQIIALNDRLERGL